MPSADHRWASSLRVLGLLLVLPIMDVHCQASLDASIIGADGWYTGLIPGQQYGGQRYTAGRTGLLTQIDLRLITTGYNEMPSFNYVPAATSGYATLEVLDSTGNQLLQQNIEPFYTYPSDALAVKSYVLATPIAVQSGVSYDIQVKSVTCGRVNMYAVAPRNGPSTGRSLVNGQLDDTTDMMYQTWINSNPQPAANSTSPSPPIATATSPGGAGSSSGQCTARLNDLQNDKALNNRPVCNSAQLFQILAPFNCSANYDCRTLVCQKPVPAAVASQLDAACAGN